jgi:hypothetical protein
VRLERHRRLDGRFHPAAEERRKLLFDGVDGFARLQVNQPAEAGLP